MFSSFNLASVLAFASIASALVLPRATQPKSYDSAILEPYAKYHERYLALDCQSQHGTSFFNTCCHPVLINEKLSSLPAECTPSGEDPDCNDPPAQHTSTTSHTPHATAALAHHTSATSHTHHTTTSHAPQATKAATANKSPAGNFITGGVATFFFQNGVAGACGTVHRDSDFICAMDSARYGNSGNSSPLCGRQVQIINEQNGKSVTVTVADDCPTCNNANSIDLSHAAFSAIANPTEGEVPIKWKFV